MGRGVCRCVPGLDRRRYASGLGLWDSSGGFGLRRGLVELDSLIGSYWIGFDGSVGGGLGLGLGSGHGGFCLLVGLSGWFGGFGCLGLRSWRGRRTRLFGGVRGEDGGGGIVEVGIGIGLVLDSSSL